jgi:hypothetical protein
MALRVGRTASSPWALQSASISCTTDHAPKAGWRAKPPLCALLIWISLKSNTATTKRNGEELCV